MQQKQCGIPVLFFLFKQIIYLRLLSILLCFPRKRKNPIAILAQLVERIHGKSQDFCPMVWKQPFEARITVKDQSVVKTVASLTLCFRGPND